MVGLIVCASIAAVTGLLADVLTRRGIPSAHSQAEADGLARLAAQALALGPGTRQEMAAALRRTFDLDAVPVFRRAGRNLAAQDARLLREFSTELRLAQEQIQLSYISPHPGTNP